MGFFTKDILDDMGVREKSFEEREEQLEREEETEKQY